MTESPLHPQLSRMAHGLNMVRPWEVGSMLLPRVHLIQRQSSSAARVEAYG